MNLTVKSLDEIRDGKMKSAGIWIEVRPNKKTKKTEEKVFVRVRQSKNKWLPMASFDIEQIQLALNYFNKCVSEKILTGLNRNVKLAVAKKENPIMKIPLSILIDECVKEIKARKMAPWKNQAESTLFKKHYALSRLTRRFFRAEDDPTAINQRIDKQVRFGGMQGRADVNLLLKQYEKQVQENAFKLIGNMTLNDIVAIGKENNSTNGFAIILSATCYTVPMLKTTLWALKDFCRFIQGKYDPERTMTSWFPRDEDFKNIAPDNDRTVKRNTKQYYSKPEVEAILKVWYNPRANANLSYPLLFELGRSSGPRLGELSALTPSDIDYVTNKISITKTASVNVLGRQMISNQTKTRAIRETLEIDPKTIAKLRIHIEKKKIKFNELIFTTNSGGIISTQAFNTALKRICKLADVKYLTSHPGIRKTFINHAVNKISTIVGDKEEAIETIAKAVGHSPEVCKDNYYVQKAADEAIANKAVASLFDVAEKPTRLGLTIANSKDDEIAELRAEIARLKRERIAQPA